MNKIHSSFFIIIFAYSLAIAKSHSIEHIERAGSIRGGKFQHVIKDVLAFEHCHSRESYERQADELQESINDASTAEEPLISRSRLEAMVCSYGAGIGTAVAAWWLLWSNGYISINWK